MVVTKIIWIKACFFNWLILSAIWVLIIIWSLAGMLCHRHVKPLLNYVWKCVKIDEGKKVKHFTHRLWLDSKGPLVKPKKWAIFSLHCLSPQLPASPKMKAERSKAAQRKGQHFWKGLNNCVQMQSMPKEMEPRGSQVRGFQLKGDLKIQINWLEPPSHLLQGDLPGLRNKKYHTLPVSSVLSPLPLYLLAMVLWFFCTSCHPCGTMPDFLPPPPEYLHEVANTPDFYWSFGLKATSAGQRADLYPFILDIGPAM